jgi:cytochrome c oxidase subunit II
MGIFYRRICAALAFAASALASSAFVAAACSSPAFAGDGQPTNWEIGFQTAETPIMQQIESFHAFVTAIVVVISLFVMGMLLVCIIRFNEKRNPVPSRTTHNTTLEIAWTIIPILILVAIAIPSFRLLFAQYDYPKPFLTVTATGHQWYWSYDYPKDNISFDSIMVQDADLKPGQPRMLTVDNPLVVPVNKNIIVDVKSSDVIHDWAVPSFGVKLDAVPGRLQKTWFRALHTGLYHGECSELCGRNHAFMPIVVKVVTEKEFEDWLTKTKQADAGSKSNDTVASTEEHEDRLKATAYSVAATDPAALKSKTKTAAAPKTKVAPIAAHAKPAQAAAATLTASERQEIASAQSARNAAAAQN